MSYSASRNYFRFVLYVMAALVGLPMSVFLLWLFVRCVTTSYHLEWVGSDGCVWKEMHELPIENGDRLLVEFDYLNYARKDRYSIVIESGCGIALQDKVVTMQVVGRNDEPYQLNLLSREFPDGRRRYFAVLPVGFMPQKENEVLLIRFRVCSKIGLLNNEVVLEFKSRLVRHYVDLIMDIT